MEHKHKALDVVVTGHKGDVQEAIVPLGVLGGLDETAAAVSAVSKGCGEEFAGVCNFSVKGDFYGMAFA